jgi:exonuclease V gamma subunit
MLKKGDKVLMYDAEDESETWDLTLDKLLNGIKLTIENGYWSGKIDDIDGAIGDIIFQYALFNEIVFG